MKKIISVLAAIALVFGCAAALPEGGVSSDEMMTAAAETYGDFEYTVLDDVTVEISKYTGEATNVSIPEVIDGKKGYKHWPGGIY